MSEQIYYCVVSGKPIPTARVEALQSLGVPQENWTCVEHSYTKHRKGIFLGEVGTSELLIVDKVYDDSVRSVFKGAQKEVANKKDTEEPEEDDGVQYNNKEISYYTSDDETACEEEKMKIIKRQD